MFRLLATVTHKYAKMRLRLRLGLRPAGSYDENKKKSINKAGIKPKRVRPAVKAAVTDCTEIALQQN